jgi:hypothetical protein
MAVGESVFETSTAPAGADSARESQRLQSLVITLAVIAGLWLAAASRWSLADAVVPWDAKNQFYAFFRFLASALHSGHTPFWNPYHYGGHPSVADPQSLVFAPAFVAWAWFDATPSMRAFDLIVYAHLGIGGLAIGALGWRAGWPLPASVLAATVFMFGGPASGRLQHTGAIICYGLFPLALLLLLAALGRRSVLVGAGFGVVAAVLAHGRNHEALLLCFVLAAILAGEIATAARPGRYLRERWPVLAVMGGVSALLVAPPLLLTLQFAALSNRPEVPLDIALQGSLYPANLASLAVANIMGSLEATQAYWGPNHETVPAVAATDRSFNYLFVGAAAMVVLVWLGIAGGRLLRRGNRMLTAMLAVALLYALGRYTPLYGLAFTYVPGINLFRRPIDGAFVLVALLALLAGQLLADYVREGVPAVPRGRLLAVVAGVLVIIASAVLFADRTHHGWPAVLEVGKTAVVVIATLVVLARAKGANARLASAACVAALAATELLWFNAASGLNAEPPGYYAVLQRPGGAEAEALAVLEREVVARHAQGERPRVEIVGVSGPWQNLAMTRGLEATNGYNPLRIGAYDRLVAPGETTHIVDQRRFPLSFSSYDCALARELGLEYVVLGRPIEQVPHLARRPVADVLLNGPRIWIYRLRGARPRVELIPHVGSAGANGNVRSTRFATLSIDGGLDRPMAEQRLASPASMRTDLGHARILSWSIDRVEVETRSAQPGMLLLHELYYPGWVAEVDGTPVPIRRADVLFRGVDVARGRHVVVFRFTPFSLANLGNAVSGILHDDGRMH